MHYIYLDESGDLGFNRVNRSSRYFIITCLICTNKRSIEKVIANRHKNMKVIVEKRETNKYLNSKFMRSVDVKDIKLEKPSSEKCLQAVDFISWSIFRKYEHSDPTYFNLIKSKIKKELVTNNKTLHAI